MNNSVLLCVVCDSIVGSRENLALINFTTFIDLKLFLKMHFKYTLYKTFYFLFPPPYSYSGEDVRLMIWDTAGQEEFDAITKAYYRGY